MPKFKTAAEDKAYKLGFEKGQGIYTDKEGVKRHSCGRELSSCVQMNGKYWCEIIKEPYYGNYDG